MSKGDINPKEMYWLAAYVWLCQRRLHAPANVDVWDLRFKWSLQQSHWLDRMLAGEYRLSPMQVISRYQRRWVQWSAMDAPVLKWVAVQVDCLLPKHPHCNNLKGHGGVTRPGEADTGITCTARIYAVINGISEKTRWSVCW